MDNNDKSESNTPSSVITLDGRLLKASEAVEGTIKTQPPSHNRFKFKSDQEKPIAGGLKDFNLALIEVAKLMTLGAKKYKRSSWLSVPNAEQRYYDSLWRHLLGFDDVEGDLGHDVAVVFNALAVLQLRLLRESSVCRCCKCDLSEIDINVGYCAACETNITRGM